MISVYVVYAFSCPFSQMIFNQLVHIDRWDSRTPMGTRSHNLEIRHLDMGALGNEDTSEAKKLIHESKVVLILWSKYCYLEDPNGGGKVRDFILNELKEVGNGFWKKQIVPVVIGDADRNLLKDSIIAGCVPSNVGSVAERIDKAIRLELRGNYNTEQFWDDCLTVYHAIVRSVSVPFVVPYNFKRVFVDHGFTTLNEGLRESNGGIYFEIRNTQVDYASVLEKALDCSKSRFFATLRPKWYLELIKGERLTSPNFAYLQDVNKKVMDLLLEAQDGTHPPLPRGLRLWIGADSKDIGEYEDIDPAKYREFLKCHSNILLYYTTEQNLSDLLQDKTAEKVPDMAVFDDSLVVQAVSLGDPSESQTNMKQSEIIQTYLLHENRISFVIYKTITTAIKQNNPKIKLISTPENVPANGI